MTDYLAPLTPQDVAAFYRRLANHIRALFSGQSLASDLLIHWLDGKGQTKIFDATFVKDVSFVKDYLKTEVRPVFLTQKQAQIKPRQVWGGVIPRILKTPPFHNQPGAGATGPMPMMYEGPSVTIPLSVQTKATMGMTVDPRELDLLYALHRFGIITEVVVTATKVAGSSSRYNIKFIKWESKVIDDYNWDASKGITVPNPDYKTNYPGAVASTEESIKVYHKHAIRVEKAGLAHPFHLESTRWHVNDPAISGSAKVDTSQCTVITSGIRC